MIIDSHAHVMLPPARQLELMKEAEIDKTILFSTLIHPETATTMLEFETELNGLYDILNSVKNPHEARVHAITELAHIVKGNPDKYLGFGSIPFGLTYEENLSWIEKYIVANNFRGIGELTPGTGQVGGLEALFKASQEIGNLPLWVHAFCPLNFDDIKELLQLAKKFPSVPVILGHLGGIHWLNTIKAVKDIQNVYLDLSATFTTIAPSIAIKELPKRTLFSSDAPYSIPLAARTILSEIVSDKHVLQEVLGGNIARLLEL